MACNPMDTMTSADFSWQILHCLGYVFPTTRVDSGLEPVRLRPCWTHNKKGPFRKKALFIINDEITFLRRKLFQHKELWHQGIRDSFLQ